MAAVLLRKNSRYTMASNVTKDPPMSLSPKHERFVREYLVDRNATAAYRRAGYAARGHSAENGAYRLMKNDEVRAAIEAEERKLAERLQISLARILDEHRGVAFADICDIIDFRSDIPQLKAVDEIPEGARHAIRSLKVRSQSTGSGGQGRITEVIEIQLRDKDRSLAELEKFALRPKTNVSAPSG